MASTRYGYVIKMGGDPEIANALRDGVVKGTPAPASGSEAVRRVAMHQHTPEEWAAMTTQGRCDYGQTRPAPRLAQRLLVAWAMLCYGIAQAYKAQDKVLERRG
jgi:hypothetical protein